VFLTGQSAKIYSEMIDIICRIYRKIVRTSKGVLWSLMPALTIRFYRARRLRHDSIVILVHEGLGDLAAIAAAIKEASREHRLVYIVSNRNYFNAISLIFQFGDNVKNIRARAGKYTRYKISNKRLKVFKRCGYLIKLGSFGCDPVFHYPDSFYIKLGFNPSLATKKFYVDFSKHPNTLLDDFLKRVGRKFVFISNGTSEGCLETSMIKEISPDYAVIVHSNDLQVKQIARAHDISRLNQGDFTRSLLNSLYICCIAEYAILSDAGVFNILVRLENKSNLRVIFRKHWHDLNEEIYSKYYA
jgi:hypothetical protein